MAIVPMKRMVLVAPADRLDGLLAKVQELGALHLIPLEDSPELPADLVGRVGSLKRQVALVSGRAKAAAKRLSEGRGPSDALRKELAGLDPAGVAARVDGALARRVELDARLASLRKDEEAALPWGKVTAAALQDLQRHGLNLALIRLRSRDLKAVDAALAAHPGRLLRRDLELPGRGRPAKGLLLASTEPLPEVPGELLEPPPRALAELEQDRAQLEAKLAQVEAELDALAERGAALGDQLALAQDELALAGARAQSHAERAIHALAGWCPASAAAAMKAAVLAAGGALLVRDPKHDEEPPVALKNPAIISYFEPLLGAFQLPRYREGDPTAFIAPFMGLFFGFCLGDAGYGVVLWALATLASHKLRPKGEAKKAVRLLQTLGLATVVVGLLTGNLFGVPLYQVPGKFNFGLDPDALLFFLSAKPDKFFYTALIFGVVQLSFGMLIRLVRNLRAAEWQLALGSLAWFLVMPALAAAMLPALGATWIPFIAVVVLILLFNSPSPKVAARLGGGAWALYNMTGLFGDVMSYARIFGLGLSSGIIAQVINIIALTVKDALPYGLGWVGALLILLAGHTFNFAMAIIGSLVHPARLQFLEFFGKFFEGGGQAYSPFARSKGGGTR